MRFYLTLFTFLITITAFSQKTSCHKFIPYFSTLNAKKLSYSLTHNLQDDSSKVYAIHCWITHHIKYGIKKSEKFDFDRIPVKRILLKRKAICTGYSDLFNELCKYANITSTSITGYTKNIHVDLNDKFYIDEHIWNAVYINNEWKLIDACWDAGYIKPYKRTFLGHFVYIFSFGNKEIIKFKQNFKFYPTNKYYYKNGNEFIIDHIPSNPIWQLIAPITAIEQSEKDSSYYLKARKVINKKEYSPDDNLERLHFAAMTQKEKDIYNGPVTYAYNHKNHYHIAVSQFILASDLYNEIDKKSTDTVSVLNQCNNVLPKLNSVSLHIDSAIYFLNKQKTELRINNTYKNESLNIQNRNLISSTKKAERTIKSGKQISINAKNTIRKIKKTNLEHSKKLARSNRITRAKKLVFYSSFDSTNSVRKTEIIKDSLLLINQRITRHFLHLDSLYTLYIEKFGNYRYGSSLNTAATEALTERRLHYYDNMDYEIRTIKDSILKYKFTYDALLFESNNVFIIKSLLKEINKLKADFRNLYRFHKSLANEFVKLKKYHVEQNSLIIQYDNNLKYYAIEIEKYNNLLNSRASNTI